MNSLDHPVLGRDDRRMPTMDDVDRTHELYPTWHGIAPLPNARMMLHVGAESVENFLVVGDAWAQLIGGLLQPGSAVLDIGCGCGRTARMLLKHPYVLRYLGFDVVPAYPAWCQRWLAPRAHGRFEFAHLDVRSSRYNPDGTVEGREAVFPADDATYDLAFAASLFTHLVEADARRYLAESRRVLKKNGLLVASIHDHPTSGQYSGDEHRADVALAYFETLARAAGFERASFIPDVCGQATFELRAV